MPCTASKMLSSSDRAVRGSKITGTFWVSTLRAPRRRRARCGGDAAHVLGRFQAGETAREREPVVALHATRRRFATGTVLREQ